MHDKNKNQEFKKVMFSISILNSNEKLVEYFMIHNSWERTNEWPYEQTKWKEEQKGHKK